MDRSKLVSEVAAKMEYCLEKLDSIGADLPAVHLATAIDALQREFHIGTECSTGKQI